MRNSGDYHRVRTLFGIFVPTKVNTRRLDAKD